MGNGDSWSDECDEPDEDMRASDEDMRTYYMRKYFVSDEDSRSDEDMRYREIEHKVEFDEGIRNGEINFGEIKHKVESDEGIRNGEINFGEINFGGIKHKVESDEGIRNGEIKHKVESDDGMRNGEIKESDEDNWAEYCVRGRKDDNIYIKIKKGPRDLWIGEYPPITACYTIQTGANFLKKTVEINPDGYVTNMVRDEDDVTLILVKGEESVCAVARPKIKGLKGHICGIADAFIFGEMPEFPPGPSDLDMMRRPFASITYCLDTTKEDVSKEACGDSPSEKHPEFPCHEDFGDLCNEKKAMKYLEKRPSYLKGFGARFNEQKALNYLVDKMKQDCVMRHEETKQAVITAFMYLLKEDFKIDEIMAYAVGKDLKFEEALSGEEILKHLISPDFLSRVSG